MVAAALGSWNVEPPLVFSLACAVLYWLGGRRQVSSRRLGLERRGRAALFYSGLAAIVLALDSPLDSLSSRLFAAHMTQHVLLLSVAPPLIVASAPWSRLWQPLPLDFRRAAARMVVLDPGWRLPRAAARELARPLPAFVLFNLNLLVWHVPALYDATLDNAAVHDLEHALFLLTGLLFWGQVIDSPPFRSRLDPLHRLAFVTGGIAVGWVLAIVLALARSPLYAAYASLDRRPGGLSALGDQQIAAGVMWVPGSLAFTIAFALILYRWLGPEPSASSAARPARLGVAGTTDS
ncbi:MAG TPA: cytochrome c oxidase assembly protein [Gaiellaceae bacterium]|jgi:cytochrome c oxidase assembly factor CtaG